MDKLPCLFSFIQMVGHDAGRAGRGNHGDIHALLQGFYAGPPSGSFLFGAVFDAVNELSVRQVVGLPEAKSNSDSGSFSSDSMATIFLRFSLTVILEP